METSETPLNPPLGRCYFVSNNFVRNDYYYTRLQACSQKMFRGASKASSYIHDDDAQIDVLRARLARSLGGGGRSWGMLPQDFFCTF